MKIEREKKEQSQQQNRINNKNKFKKIILRDTARLLNPI